jgi:hypothetical protein
MEHPLSIINFAKLILLLCSREGAHTVRWPKRSEGREPEACNLRVDLIEKKNPVKSYSITNCNH